MSTKKTTLLAFGLLALSALPAVGQSHPNRTKGFDPRGTYSIGEVDSVNLFNGALTVTIPLGPRYPVGSSDYGFALVYNSNAWTVREVCFYDVTFSGISFSSSLGVRCEERDTNGDGDTDDRQDIVCAVDSYQVGWSEPRDEWVPRPPDSCHDYSLPNPTTNAGLGWQLNLGKLLEGMRDNEDTWRLAAEGGSWTYVGPDGAHHGLDTASDGAFYSRDGSYLRMQSSQACGPGIPCREVAFADGGVEIFRRYGTEAKPDWRLLRKQDAFGRGFGIDSTNELHWVVSDDEERQHELIFHPAEGEFPPTLDSLLLDAPEDRTLEVDLRHTDPIVIERGAPHNGPTVLGGTVVPTIPVRFLTAIETKESGALLSRWAMEPLAEAYPTNDPLTSRINGALRQLKLPTGATIAWTYGGGYRYPNGSSGRGHLRSTVGVLSRKVTDVTGTAIGTWTYAPELEDRPADSDCNLGGNIPWLEKCHEKQFTNTVSAPGGYRTKHYFSVYPLPPFFLPDGTAEPLGWDGADFGLPFTRSASVSLGGETLYLSSETFATAGATEPVRREYLRYGRDEPRPLPPGTEPGVLLVWDGFHGEILDNSRVEARAVVFADDTNAESEELWRLTTYDRWDGKGHFRDEIVRSNFPGEVNRSRKTTTEYTGTRPAKEQKWFLGQFTEVVTQDFASSAVLAKQVRQVCFDGATPFISRTRTLAGNSAGPDDVLAVFTSNTEGQVTEERLFGGDGARLDTGPLCSSSLPATPTSWVLHSYQHGVRSKSVVKEPCSGTDVVTLLDQTIDPSGVPTLVKDPTGIGVTLSYDALGRRTVEQPDAGEGARTEYEYKLPGIGGHGATSEPQVIVRRKAGEQGAQLAVSQVHFDGLGRAVADATWMPPVPPSTGQPIAVSRQLLSAQGWTLQASTPRCSSNDLGAACTAGSAATDISAEIAAAFPTNGVTKYEQYDPFGRPGRVVAPDGFVSTATYTGVREVERKVKVGTGVGELSDAKRTETYDFLGRLASVSEPSGTSGEDVTTRYDYDVGDRLVSVSTTEGTGSEAVTQRRAFRYDGRGFLLSETHPELGQYGNGTKKYSGYDARGLAGSATVLLEGGYPDGDRQLDFRYDAVGRLIEVQNGNRPLEQYFYAWGNGPAGHSAGKIVEARRFNTGSGVTVAETYKYEGRAGRVSERTTRTSLGHQFKIAATYNLLGDVETVTYPTCTGLAGCEAETVSPPRTVTYGYQLGFLTKVGEGTNPVAWLSATEYSPSGRWRKLTRGNDTIDEQVGDPKGLGRPKEFKVYNEDGLLWETGAGGYTYDGAGNITGMGPERFTYDKVSRLKSGTVKTLPLDPATPASETLSYDAFGNQLTRAVTGAESTPSLPVNPQTNRLSSGTYDVNGNLRHLETQLTPAYTLSVSHYFDALNSLLSTTQNGYTTHYLYAPGGERLATLRPGGATNWTIRGLGNEVLRVFLQDAGDTWRLDRDYIYRGGQLLASEGPEEGKYHYHLDHLGSSRLVTDDTGEHAAFHAYLPFGQEVTPPADSFTKLKYTGHEREEGMDSVSRADDLDYMHARWCSPTAGRFLSVDPVLGRVGAPQSWNRYGYVSGNPMRLVDPDGRMGLPWEVLDYYAYNQSKAEWERAWQAFWADPSGTTALNAVTAFLTNSLDSAAVLLPGLPATGGLTQQGLRIANNGPGQWARVAENMQERARAFQELVTGVRADAGYLVGGVKFDGFDEAAGVLLEAKGPGYSNFVKDGRFAEFFRGQAQLREQARRQLEAAGGTPIRWVFAEADAAEATRKLLKDAGYGEIEVVTRP